MSMSLLQLAKQFSNFYPVLGADTSQPVKAFVYDNLMQTFIIAADATLTDEATARACFRECGFFDGAAGSTSTGLSSGSLQFLHCNHCCSSSSDYGHLDDVENSDFSAAGFH